MQTSGELNHPQDQELRLEAGVLDSNSNGDIESSIWGGGGSRRAREKSRRIGTNPYVCHCGAGLDLPERYMRPESR